MMAKLPSKPGKIYRSHPSLAQMRQRQVRDRQAAQQAVQQAAARHVWKPGSLTEIHERRLAGIKSPLEMDLEKEDRRAAFLKAWGRT